MRRNCLRTSGQHRLSDTVAHTLGVMYLVAITARCAATELLCRMCKSRAWIGEVDRILGLDLGKAASARRIIERVLGLRHRPRPHFSAQALRGSSSPMEADRTRQTMERGNKRPNKSRGHGLRAPRMVQLPWSAQITLPTGLIDLDLPHKRNTERSHAIESKRCTTPILRSAR